MWGGIIFFRHDIALPNLGRICEKRVFEIKKPTGIRFSGFFKYVLSNI
jgi:hypothetical protein